MDQHQPKVYSVNVKRKDGLQRETLKIDPSTLTIMTENGDIIQSYPLNHIKRWSVGHATITFDFGDYADEYYMVHTKETDEIGSLLKQYIHFVHEEKCQTISARQIEIIDIPSAIQKICIQLLMDESRKRPDKMETSLTISVWRQQRISSQEEFLKSIDLFSDTIQRTELLSDYVHQLKLMTIHALNLSKALLVLSVNDPNYDPNFSVETFETFENVLHKLERLCPPHIPL